MNIAFLIANLENSGGTQRILCFLCNLLVENFKISIIVHHGEKTFFNLDSRIKIINLSKKKGILTKNYAIYKTLKKEKIKYYINLDSNSIILNGFILPNHTNLILWEHFSITNNYKKWLFTISRHYAVIRCKKLVFISKHEVSEWKKYNPFSKKKSNLIYNPLTINAKKIDTSNRSHLKTFLAIGNDIYIKGFDILIDAWSLQKSDWKLRIVGLSYEQINILQKLITKKNLNNIELYEKSNNINEYYQQASAFLLTSRKEATPLVLVESQAYGLPAIVFDHLPGVLELINESAIIVDFEKKEKGFCDAINKLTKNILLYEKMHHSALENAKRFSDEIFKQKWLNILK